MRRIKNVAEFDAFIDQRFVPAKIELADRFDDAFRRLSMRSFQKYRLRYVLAKLTQDVELRAHGEIEGTKRLSRFTGSGLEIEHIFAQQPSQESGEEFGEFEDPELPDRLGNLVLVEKSINASLGNQPYSQKREVYSQSQLLLTKALAERPRVGKNTRIDRAVAELEVFPEWNEGGVLRRQDMLRNLARNIWRI